MRQEPHNEIDLLLRQLSRRKGAPVSEFDEQHLDADELNSYVANALPAAARARYTQHLADCSSCRKLVAQLSAAQGPVMAQESPSVVAPSGLKSFLASLLSPMVLRYAVPALGLIVIAVVGVFVLNRESRETSVARVETTDQNKSVLQTPSPIETPIQLKKESPPKRAVIAKEDQAAKEAAPTGLVAPPSEPVATADAPPPASKAAASTEGEARDRVERPKKKLEETAAPSVAAARPATQNANEPVKSEYQTQTPLTTLAPGTGASRRVGSGVSAAAGQTRGAREDKKAESKAESDETKAKDADQAIETRSVAGRHFRKSGGVWIDTAYDSSRETTNVARGSEHYRSLVADEPAIRQIAEQLDGEIIVVWKGRAYRIR